MRDLLSGLAAAVVPGLSTASDLVEPDEERWLAAAIDDAGVAPFRYQAWEGKRLTISFGWVFDFDTGRLERGDPIPDWLSSIRTRMAAFAGLDPDDLVHALLTRYDAGAGIGWHKDRPQFAQVVGLSLGAPAVMRFRRRQGARSERASLPLEPRAAYGLSGDVRHNWEHSIAAQAGTRWSVTFRSLRLDRPE